MHLCDDEFLKELVRVQRAEAGVLGRLECLLVCSARPGEAEIWPRGAQEVPGVAACVCVCV